MPALVSLYIRNIVYGVLLAIIFVAGLLWLDIAHLRHLIFSSPMGWVALAMLVVFNAIVFSGVQFAIAIMRMAEPADDTPRGPRAPVTPSVPATVPVGAGARRQRKG